MKAAAQSSCTCAGAWSAFVVNSFLQNGINISELCKDVWTSIVDGRSETTLVMTLADLTGGEGKYCFLKALRAVWAMEGAVFNVSKESGNFKFLDLLQAKIAFLDDYRFDPDILSWGSLCLWFDGSDVPVGRPQIDKGFIGNCTYKGTAPIFITTKLTDLQNLEAAAAINPQTGAPHDSDASMLLRRLKIYRFRQRVSKPCGKMAFCGCCFAKLVLAQAGVTD